MASRDSTHKQIPPATHGDRIQPDHQIPPVSGVGEPARTPLGDLVRSLAEDTGTLVRQEIRLAKLEAGRTARRLAVDSAWIAAGAGILAVGGLCLILALALGLGALLDSYWLGTLVTGLILAAVGLLVAWKGARDLREGELMPTGTMETLQEDADWAKSEVRDFRNQLTKE